MPRRLRVASGGYVYHVLNRAVGRARIFGKRRDFEAFEEVIGQANERLPMRVLAWCVLSNHWHFVFWPRGDGDLSEFMRWLSGKPAGTTTGTSIPVLVVSLEQSTRYKNPGSVYGTEGSART